MVSKHKSDQLNKWLLWLGYAVFLIILFLIAVRSPADPDMGWHIRNGGDILKFGAPTGDLYSFTMFGYPWISHEWLTDVGFYLLVQKIGIWILPLVFALITLLAYVIATMIGSGLTIAGLFAALLGIMASLPILGVRAQMISLLGLALTMAILFKWRDGNQPKVLYWLIPLFLLWANLHGGFVAGLIFIAGFGFFEVIKLILIRIYKWKIAKHLDIPQLMRLLVVGLACVLVVLVNPYGWHLYEELYRTITNDLAMRGIVEWMPVNWHNPNGYNFSIYALLLTGFIIATWRKLDLTKLGIGLMFLLLAVTSWRNLPLFSIATLPLLTEILTTVSPKAINILLRSVWIWVTLIGIVGYIGWERWHTVYPTVINDQALAQAGRYPYETVEYIKNNNLRGNMFNEYNWGGYLVWQLPEKKVFIDGRMAIWTAPDQNIFKDYINISNQEPGFEEILSKYNIGLALVFKDQQLKNYFSKNPERWSLLIEDDLSMLFQRQDLLFSDK